MPTAAECRAYAAERLGVGVYISIQPATALLGIAHQLDELAFQLDRLATIVKSEDKQGRLSWRLSHGLFRDHWSN